MTTNDGYSAFPPPATTGAEQTKSSLVPGQFDPAVGPRSGGPRRVRTYLVIGLALGLVVIVGLIAFLVTRDDDGSDGSSAGARLTGYDPRSNEVTVYDSSGEIVDTFDGPDVDEANPVAGLSDRLVFEGDDEVAVMSIDDGAIDTYDVPEGLDLHQPLSPADTNLVFDTLNGGDVVIVDLATGDSTSVVEDNREDDEAAFGPSRQFDGASTYTDFRSDVPRSVVVPTSGGADYWIVEGSVVALDGERTLSASGDEGEAHLRFSDRDEATGDATLDQFVAGGVLTGETTALVVDLDGDILTVDGKSGDSEVVDSLDGPVRTVFPVSSERLLVVGEDGGTSYLIDAKGKIVAEFESEEVGGEEESISVNYGGILAGASCFITQPGNAVIAEDDDNDDGLVVLRDIETGEPRTEFDVSAYLLATNDGCSAATYVDTVADVALDGELTTFDDYTNVTSVAPDRSHAVLNDKGDYVLRDVESGDDVDLDPGFYFYVPS